MKLAPVYRALRESGSFEQKIVHTGQHYDHFLSQQFIDEFSIPQPDVNLDVGSASHTEQTGESIKLIGRILQSEKPDMVFVYGDTNSTAAGAIAAAKCNIGLAHVESGLREHDKSIPEEVNKLITDAVADLLYCPTMTAVKNLKAAGHTQGVHLVGDVVLDLLFQHDWSGSEETVHQFNLTPHEYGMVTIHRSANTDDSANLIEIIEALEQIDEDFIFPIHPRTKRALSDASLLDRLLSTRGNIIDPIGFWHTQDLLRNADWAITDSGGIIKESYFHRVPCVIVDKQTEWIESVQEGWASIAGPSTFIILDQLRAISRNREHSGFLGDGTASQRIADVTEQYLLAKLRRESSIN